MSIPNYLVIDTESTGFHRASHGSALDPRNTLCYVGAKQSNNRTILLPIDWLDQPYGSELGTLDSAIRNSDLLVFFNAKHDLHWLRRYGIKFLDKKIWDTQTAKFIMDGQENRFPALNDCLEEIGFPPKLDVVKTEYWEKGLDTSDVPTEILEEYLEQDCLGTESTFLWQIQELSDRPQLKRIIWNVCQDELVLEEMEWNGLKYDTEMSLRMAREMESLVVENSQKLYELFPNPNVNFDAPLQNSALLYGGTIKYDSRELIQKTLKSGITKEYLRWFKREVEFPQIVVPLPRSGLATEGLFATDDKTLRKLKPSTPQGKEAIKLILERRKIQKRLGTYFLGLPKLAEEMGWTSGLLHGSLNCCVADTGRLSSDHPNQQNLDELVRKCIVTRFPL